MSTYCIYYGRQQQSKSNKHTYTKSLNFNLNRCTLTIPWSSCLDLLAETLEVFSPIQSYVYKKVQDGVESNYPIDRAGHVYTNLYA